MLVMCHLSAFGKKQAYGLLALGLAFVTAAQAAPASADKSQYNWSHPVPADLLRELSADRPDKTESPFTVDAGHYQLEADVVNYTYDRHNPDRRPIHVDDFQLANVNIKAGILNNLDAQLVIESYNSSRVED